MTEYVYVLTNPRMPDLIKIGRTADFEKRLRQLSQHSGVPIPFECYCCFEVDNSERVEKIMHEGFADNRLTSHREFFEISPESARTFLEALSIKEYFPSDDGIDNDEERNSLNKEKSKRSAFSFSQVNIPEGSILTFINDETITAKVIGNRQIEFEEKETSLSSATQALLERAGRRVVSVRGPDFWKFGNQTLTARRLMFEDSE